MNEINLSEIENLAKKMRISAIETGFKAGKNAAHFGGAELWTLIRKIWASRTIFLF